MAETEFPEIVEHTFSLREEGDQKQTKWSEMCRAQSAQSR